MSETQLALLRGLLKIVGTALATHGILSANDLTVIQPAIEAVAGAAVTLYSVYLSHRSAKAVDAAKAA